MLVGKVGNIHVIDFNVMSETNHDMMSRNAETHCFLGKTSKYPTKDNKS